MEKKKGVKYNQYFTDKKIANFMSNYIKLEKNMETISILDPGSGEGILGIEAIKYIANHYKNIKNINLWAYEIDFKLIEQLKENYNKLKKELELNEIKLNFNVLCEDFLEVKMGKLSHKVDVILMNPPYERIKKESKVYNFMKEQGYSSVNLYSSFLEKSLDYLKKEGQLIAIIPRSFANGSYYRTFREKIFTKSIITNIHSFESRNIFKGTLQENLIIKLVVEANLEDNQSEEVEISHSFGNDIKKDFKQFKVDRELIIDRSKNFQLRIIKNYLDLKIAEDIHSLENDLVNLQIEVSTGPIVDFREGFKFKRKIYEKNAVPYLFPEHFDLNKKIIEWPKYPVNKENFIVIDKLIEKKLKQNLNYVLIRRFSSKEEKKRINAVIWSSKKSKTNLIGLDNKINFFHSTHNNLDINLAKGICLYLNSTKIDLYFRQVSGSTQVNVSDLRNLKYPNRKKLISLGKLWDIGSDLSQNTIDNFVNDMIFK